jgi:hypothetical protein
VAFWAGRRARLSAGIVVALRAFVGALLARLLAAIERLSAAVESGDGTLASLTSRLTERERDLAIVRSRRRAIRRLASPR